MNLIYTTDLQNENDLLEFYQKIGWNNFLKLSTMQLTTTMKQSTYVVYVYSNDDLVGTGRIISDGVIHAYICGLGVLPDYRNLKIGTGIMKMLKEFCQKQNLRVKLTCEESLIPYYTKLGFSKAGVEMTCLERGESYDNRN